MIKPAIGAVTSRWVLYHGTSTRRFKTILKEGILRTSNPGEPTIALTTERSVTEYFACNVVAGHRHDHPEDESSGTVLVLDAEWLLSLNSSSTLSRSPNRIPLRPRWYPGILPDHAAGQRA